MHIAIIMDGNGRWALRKRLPRTAGHRAGAEAVNKVVEAAARRRIGTLTLYAFSTENWRRPAGEVAEVMRLLKLYVNSDLDKLAREGVKVRILGRRVGLPLGFQRPRLCGLTLGRQCRHLSLLRGDI